ncbi:hypothetical protein KKA15_03290 [Patescibacteria group bacterium]|nr:hypothetical protein [Patescibacteria group bacterium]
MKENKLEHICIPIDIKALPDELKNKIEEIVKREKKFVVLRYGYLLEKGKIKKREITIHIGYNTKAIHTVKDFRPFQRFLPCHGQGEEVLKVVKAVCWYGGTHWNIIAAIGKEFYKTVTINAMTAIIEHHTQYIKFRVLVNRGLSFDVDKKDYNLTLLLQEVLE